MKLSNNILHCGTLFLSILYFLTFKIINAAMANDLRYSSLVVDEVFLNHINILKKQMIKEGSEFKNVTFKFISKTNRYVIAAED